QAGIAGRPENRLDVREALVGYPLRDRINHLPLDVFGVDAPVGADAPRQADREPAAAGADVGYPRSVGNPERIHDPIGLLPFVAVGTLENTEILRRKQPSVCRSLGR